MIRCDIPVNVESEQIFVKELIVHISQFFQQIVDAVLDNGILVGCSAVSFLYG